VSNDREEDRRRHHPAGVGSREERASDRVKEVTVLGTGGRLRQSYNLSAMPIVKK